MEEEVVNLLTAFTPANGVEVSKKTIGDSGLTSGK